MEQEKTFKLPTIPPQYDDTPITVLLDNNGPESANEQKSDLLSEKDCSPFEQLADLQPSSHESPNQQNETREIKPLKSTAKKRKNSSHMSLSLEPLGSIPTLNGPR